MNSVYAALQQFYGNYIVVMLIASVVNSISQIGIKLLSDDNSVFQILFIRALVVFLVLAFAIHQGDGKYFGNPETYFLLFLRGFIGSIALVLGTFATFLLPFVDSTFLLNIYPATTAVAAFMLKLERPTFRCWLGVFGCFIGVAIFAEPTFVFGGDGEEWDLQRIAGFVTAITCQALVGYTFTIMRQIGESASVAANAFAQSIGVLAISVPFLPTSFPKPFNYTPSLEEFGLYALMAVSSLGYQVLLARGFQIGSAVKSSIILLSTMVYSATFGILVLSDDASVFTFVGAGVLTMSVILVIVSRGEKESNYQDDENLLSNYQEPLR